MVGRMLTGRQCNQADYLTPRATGYEDIIRNTNWFSGSTIFGYLGKTSMGRAMGLI